MESASSIKHRLAAGWNGHAVVMTITLSSLIISLGEAGEWDELMDLSNSKGKSQNRD